jgi:hypothetical protein
MANLIDPWRTDKCPPKPEAVSDSATIAVRPNPSLKADAREASFCFASYVPARRLAHSRWLSQWLDVARA